MPGSFHGIDLASRALRAFQRQLDVTGHNIGNVNTPGYSRQVAELQQSEGLTVYGVRPYTLGTGVNLHAVNRIRDMFLEARRMGEVSEHGRFAHMAQTLDRVQGVMLEPGPNGIAQALDRFFNAWSALASNPMQPGARQEVQLAGQMLTSRVRSTYAALQQTEQQLSVDVNSTFGQIDELAGRIADLNTQIRQKKALGEQPNDLLDARDETLQKLSALVDIRTHEFEDGGTAVYINQFTLVDSSGARPIPRTFDASSSTVTDGNFTYDIRSGKLAGLFQSLNSLSSYRGQLDTLANTLKTELNGLHATGTNPNGTTGINFFADADPQTGAIDFALDAAILADINNISSGTSGNGGDGSLALAFSRLRDEGLGSLNGRTFGQYYGDLIGSIGRDASYYSTAAETRAAVIDQIDMQRQSISGVSLDDEMANMMRYQRSYQAAAKILAVFDQVTEDLIGMLRR